MHVPQRIQFVVKSDGSIANVTNLSTDARPDFIAEAIRVITLMPAWIPGQLGDRPVNVRYTIPISFKLEKPEKKKLKYRKTLFGE